MRRSRGPRQTHGQSVTRFGLEGALRLSSGLYVPVPLCWTMQTRIYEETETSGFGE